jgi:hypothetical protein
LFVSFILVPLLSVSVSPSKTTIWAQFFFLGFGFGFGFGVSRDGFEEEKTDEAGYTGCYGVRRRASDVQGRGGSGGGERRVWLFGLL